MKSEHQIIFDSVPAMIWYKDKDNRILRANRYAAQSIGKKVSEVEGRSTYDLYPNLAAKYHKDDLEVIRTGKPKVGIVETYETPQGGMGWVRTDKIPYRDESGRIIGVIVFAVDITPRMRAQEELRKSQERFHGIYNYSRDAMGFVSFNGEFLDVNEAFTRLTGYSRDELIRRKKFQDLTPPEYHAREAKIVRRIVATGEPAEFEKEYVRKDGSRVPIAVTGYLVKDANGRPDGLAAIIRDITERKRLEREILEVGEREKARIGQDLHDGLGQSLTGIALLAQVLRERLAAFGSPEAPEARRIANLANQAVQQAKDLARGLVPVELRSSGLAGALRVLSLYSDGLLGLPCSVRCPKQIPIKDAVALHLYRIAQEAVHNAAKHGKAKNVSIQLSRRGSRITMTVADDGVGIELGNRKSAGMGLGIMRYRARMMGASFDVRRLAGGGTAVTCSVLSS